MRKPGLIAFACFVLLIAIDSHSFADDASYTGASLVAPTSVTHNTSFDVSGDFTKSLTGPATSYVIVEILDSNYNIAYSNSSAMTSSGLTSVTYNTAGGQFVGTHPIITNTGNYTIRVRAMRKVTGMPDQTLKTITAPITST